jgi:hypothetical protein
LFVGAAWRHATPGLSVEGRVAASRRRRLLPGFHLTRGVTLVYAAIIILLPIAAMVLKSASLGPEEILAHRQFTPLARRLRYHLRLGLWRRR